MHLLIIIAAIVFSVETSAQQNFLPSEFYGLYNNELLDSYIKRYGTKAPGNFMTIYNRFVNEFERKYPNRLSDAEKQFYKKRILEVIGPKTTSRNFDINVVVNTAVSRYYSNKLQSVFSEAVLKIENPGSVIEKLNQIKTTNRLFASDIEELEKFTILGNAAMKFWNIDKPPQSGTCMAGNQLVLANMTGGMFGLIGAASIAYYVQCIQTSEHGGGCM